MILAVDDAHWADEAPLRFLLYLARRIDELPIAVVLTVRPDLSSWYADLIARISAETLGDRVTAASAQRDRNQSARTI